VKRIVSGRGNALTWMVLAMALACGGSNDGPQHAAGTVGTLPPTAALSERDLDAYVSGTRAQIGLLRRTIQAGHTMEITRMDSVGARAAGMSIEQFRAIRSAVETSLKSQAVLADRAAPLDSLRIELLLLRVRAEATP
jgi:hypothetical protein